MTLSKRQIWLLAIALAALVVISLFAAPGGKRLQSGSTYGRSPDGYGAWYAFMESRGVTIHRWQKPLKSLFQPNEPKTPAIETLNSDDPDTGTISATLFASPRLPLFTPRPLRLSKSSAPATPITLLQVLTDETASMSGESIAWVERGNVLVQLGGRWRATKAPFDSTIASPVGNVRLQTSRRGTKAVMDNRDEPVLSDAFGSVVSQRTIGRGRVISASTPHFAANAYQDAPGNFEFLAKLVTEPGLQIWVDEYSHGYKDAEVIKQDAGNLIGYLAKTPLLLVALQAAAILLVLVWGQNRRLGPAIALPTPSIDNSEVYIQAMAAVLRKAESSQFVVNTVCKAEQLDVQKALGLGTEPLPLTTLLNAWTQQTGQPASVLEAALNPTKRPRRVSESELLAWLNAIQTVKRQLGGAKF